MVQREKPLLRMHRQQRLQYNQHIGHGLYQPDCFSAGLMQLKSLYFHLKPTLWAWKCLLNFRKSLLSVMFTGLFIDYDSPFLFLDPLSGNRRQNSHKAIMREIFPDRQRISLQHAQPLLYSHHMLCFTCVIARTIPKVNRKERRRKFEINISNIK